MPRAARLTLAAYAVVCLAELTTELVGPEWLALLLTACAMPLLAATVVVARPPILPRSVLVLVVAALAFSWLGDVVGQTILLKIGFFAIAQFCYVLAFWPWARSAWPPMPSLAFWVPRIAMAGFVVSLIAVLAPAAGVLTPAVAAYGLILGTMAVFALSVHRLTAIGALVFVVSDTTIAIDAFVAPAFLPETLFVIMATYFTAQLLIIVGLLRAARPAASLGPWVPGTTR